MSSHFWIDHDNDKVNKKRINETELQLSFITWGIFFITKSRCLLEPHRISTTNIVVDFWKDCRFGVVSGKKYNILWVPGIHCIYAHKKPHLTPTEFYFSQCQCQQIRNAGHDLLHHMLLTCTSDFDHQHSLEGLHILSQLNPNHG